MPQTIHTFGDRGQDREIDFLHKRIDDLTAQLTKVKPAAAIPARQIFAPPSDGTITVQTEVGDVVLQVTGLEFVAADGFSISEDNGLAKIDISGGGSIPMPATTVTDIAATGAVGTATTYAREDHAHKGVHKVDGLFGDITFSAAGGMALNVVGNNIEFNGSGIAGSGAGGGGQLTNGDTAAGAYIYVQSQHNNGTTNAFALPPISLSFGHAALAYVYLVHNRSTGALTVTATSGVSGAATIDGSASVVLASGAKAVFVAVAGPNSDSNWARIV